MNAAAFLLAKLLQIWAANWVQGLHASALDCQLPRRQNLTDKTLLTEEHRKWIMVALAAAVALDQPLEFVD
jgi:heme A synthase